MPPDAAPFIALTPIFVGRAYGRDRFLTDFLQQPEGLLNELAMHYQTKQNWNGVEPLLKGAQTTFSVNQGERVNFFVADTKRCFNY